MNYFKDISDKNPKETCYILDLCECILKIIHNEEYSLKIESFKEVPVRDRLNKDTQFVDVINGFADNLFSYYIYCKTNKINKFLRFTISFKYSIYDCKQVFTNMLKFCFKNIISRIYHDNEFNDKYDIHIKDLLAFYYNNKDILLNSIAKYSYNIKYLKEYFVLGIRYYHPMCSLNQLQIHLDNITNFIKSHKNIVLMIDDWRFLKFFIMTFYDLLIHKRIIILINIRVNDVHELLRIGYYSKDFYHTYSGFYTIIDGLKNKIDTYLESNTREYSTIYYNKNIFKH